MALLLRPANVQKNVAATFTLDLAELAALSKVPAGKYKDPSNWKTVSVRVSHSTSGQKKDIVFEVPSTTGSLLVSDSARSGTWEIYSILIRDFDRADIVLHQSDIPDVASLNFFVVSAATHGDLIVGAGQTEIIPSNTDRQYGDLIIEAGGVLQLGDGGGIATLDVLGNCVINGQIKGNFGKHTGGNWTKISPLGETLSHAVVQKAGGKGGAGEDFNGAGGEGGLSAFGNGGAGGRSAKFVAQAGDDAIDVEAGQGLGQASVADEHGENGSHSNAPAQTAGGGFRGAHGQAIYIKARQIQGSGTIDMSGQKGGDGGNGGEYLADGELYANGAGGGAAGGEGGKVWLRAKKGTPVLTINTLGGEKGSRGVASEGSTEAEHGLAGSNGSYNFSLF